MATRKPLVLVAGRACELPAGDILDVPVRSYSTNVGDGTATVFDIEHNFGSSAVHVQLREVATGEIVLADVVVLDENEIRVTFGAAPTTDQYAVSVIG